jgi:hypothetical protein
LAGQRRYRLKSTVDTISSHAATDRADQAQIGFDLGWCNDQSRVKRAVPGAPKRGVGDAGQTLLGDLGQTDWSALRKGPDQQPKQAERQAAKHGKLSPKTGWSR